MVALAQGSASRLGRDEVRIAYVLQRADLEASVEILAAAIPAYRKARGLDEQPEAAALAAAGEPDFHGPTV
jgi:hypothetical protein